MYFVGTLIFGYLFSLSISIKSESVECSSLGLDSYHEKLAQELKLSESLQLSDLLLNN